jgi:hypothetical protein
LAVRNYSLSTQKKSVMNKNPRPEGLAVRFLFTAFVLLCVAGLSGCNPNDGGDKKPTPIFNADTVRTHIISVTEARELTRSFRRGIDSFNHSCTGFKDSLKFGHAEEFPADVFLALLAEHNDKQGTAKGVRIYYGRGTDGEIKLVLVPVDSLGNDMTGTILDLKGKPTAGAEDKAVQQSAGGGQAVEQGQRCPTACDDGSSGLN